MNYFTHFGMPLALEFDKGDLRKRYYAMSREVHPDQAHLDSEMAAAINNEAYRVLSDEDARMRHILALHGEHPTDNEQLPSDFLMEMMEINEAIMEIETPEQALALIAEVGAFESEMEQDVAPYRTAWPTDADVLAETLSKLKMFVIKKKYLLRIRENLSKFAPA